MPQTALRVRQVTSSTHADVAPRRVSLAVIALARSAVPTLAANDPVGITVINFAVHATRYGQILFPPKVLHKESAKMGSANMPQPLGFKPATVKLDTTIAELYKLASPSNADTRLGMVFCGVSSGLDLTSQFPRNTKFLYQDSPFNTEPRHQLTSENQELQKSLAMKYLSLIPQRDAFISGKVPVILFNANQTPDQVEHGKREAETTFSVLDKSQQPELIFCDGPTDIPIEKYQIDKLAYKLIPDTLEKYPLIHDPEKHWYLNSKAALARSGLPTPRAEIIDIEGYSPLAAECCHLCVTDPGELPFIPIDCTGKRGNWLKDQMDRIIEAVERRPVPFVFKNQQTFGGAGTWVITTDAEKQNLLQELRSEHGSPLRKLLPQITQSNYHLQPGSVIISELVHNPVADHGLTFIVTDQGGAIFLGASEQMTDNNNAWIGSTINYSSQDEILQPKFSSLINRTAKWVASHGYFGPVGIDVLETESPGQTETQTGEVTTYHIVDVNVRPSGSLALPLLRNHFSSRGWHWASSVSITTTNESRKEFMERWKEEFMSGQMIVLSWYEDLETQKSIADVVVGGEDEDALQKKMRLVRETTGEVVF